MNKSDTKRLTPNITDPVIELMEKYEIEMTRENYIYYSFMGDVPETLDPEFLASIPSGFLDE